MTVVLKSHCARLHENVNQQFKRWASTAERINAKDLDFPGIYNVLRCNRAISADTALRLGKYFGLPAKFWMNLQAEHDLRLTAATAKLERVRVSTAS